MVRRMSFNGIRHRLQQRQNFIAFSLFYKKILFALSLSVFSTSPVGRGIITYMFIRTVWFTTLASRKMNQYYEDIIWQFHSFFFCPNYKPYLSFTIKLFLYLYQRYIITLYIVFFLYDRSLGTYFLEKLSYVPFWNT